MSPSGDTKENEMKLSYLVRAFPAIRSIRP
jgi:hypothetical protein